MGTLKAEADGIAVDEAPQPASRKLPNKKPSTSDRLSRGFIPDFLFPSGLPN